VAQFRTGLVGGGLAGATVSTAEQLTAAKAEAEAQQIEAAIQNALASPDKHIQLEGEVARMVQKFGWKVTGFQRDIGPDGSITDIDVETDNAIIEVTTSPSRKLPQIRTFQSDPRVNPTGKAVVLFSKRYGKTAGKAVTATGAFVAHNSEELYNVLKSLRSQ
jgi:hypothetical protein